jgi:hypothetical protein
MSKPNSREQLAGLLEQINVDDALKALLAKFDICEHGFPNVPLNLSGNSSLWMTPEDAKFYEAIKAQDGSALKVVGVARWNSLTDIGKIFMCICAVLFMNHPDEWEKMASILDAVLVDTAKPVRATDAALFQWVLSFAGGVLESGVWDMPAGPEVVFGALTVRELAFKGPQANKKIFDNFETVQGRNKYMAAYRDFLRSLASPYESDESSAEEESDSESSEEESSEEESPKKKKKSSKKRHSSKRDKSPVRKSKSNKKK